MAFSISGLTSSGLDTVQIVSDLMAVERIPYTNLESKKTNLRTEQNIFRTINTKLSALETAANGLRYGFEFDVFQATSTNTSVLSATVSDGKAIGSYNFDVKQLAKGATAVVQNVDGASNTWATAIKNGQVNLKVNGSEVQIDLEVLAAYSPGLGEDSDNASIMKALTTYINENLETELKATLVQSNDSNDNPTYSMSLATIGTGASKKIEMTGLPNTVTSIVGQDAKVEYNGMVISRSTNTFDNIIDGVSIEVKGEGSTTLDVKRDNSSIISKLESFVNAYNDVITTVRNNLSKPITEGTINPLQGDSILKDINNRLYSLFNDVMGSNDSYKMMSDIGLEIDPGTTKASEMTGKITLNKTKLSDALDKNSADVIKLLSYSPPDGSEDKAGIISDIASAIRDNWISSVTGILSVKITGYDSEIKMVDERLSTMERSLEMKEARLKLQFSNMEIMMNSLNSQKDWLTSQFEALTKSNS